MKNIFLVGMPSSGKSTLGRKLARALGYRFVDLDRLIVREQKQSISEIFATRGEDYFRDVESRILHDTRPDHRLVLATGGGTPCFFDNMAFIKTNGLSVFLHVSPQELAQRITLHARDDRPLFSGVVELEKELTDRLASRLTFYEQADLTVSGTIAVAQLLSLLRPLQ